MDGNKGNTPSPRKALPVIHVPKRTRKIKKGEIKKGSRGILGFVSPTNSFKKKANHAKHSGNNNKNVQEKANHPDESNTGKISDSKSKDTASKEKSAVPKKSKKGKDTKQHVDTAKATKDTKSDKTGTEADMSIDDSSKHKKKWGLLGVLIMGKQARADGNEAATKKQAHGRTNDNLKEKTATPSKEAEGDNTAKQKKEQVHGRTNDNLKEKKSSGNGARKGLWTIPTIPLKSMDSELEAEEKQRKANKYRSIHFHIAKEKQVQRVNFDSKTAQTKATTHNKRVMDSIGYV